MAAAAARSPPRIGEAAAEGRQAATPPPACAAEAGALPTMWWVNSQWFPTDRLTIPSTCVMSAITVAQVRGALLMKPLPAQAPARLTRGGGMLRREGFPQEPAWQLGRQHFPPASNPPASPGAPRRKRSARAPLCCAQAISGPLAAGLLSLEGRLEPLRGWQIMFLFEGLPAVLLGVAIGCARARGRPWDAADRPFGVGLGAR